MEKINKILKKIYKELIKIKFKDLKKWINKNNMKNKFIELLDKYLSSITDEDRLCFLKKHIKILKKQYKEIKEIKYNKNILKYLKINLRKSLSDYYYFLNKYKKNERNKF